MAAGDTRGLGDLGCRLGPVTLPSFDFAPTHDGEYHLLRLFLLDHSLRAGLWYPRWLPDLFMGFGYPLFNFYAPLTYYLGVVAIRLGLDTYGALQTVTAGAVLVGTAGMYALATGLLGTAPRGLFAAAAYVLAPYPFLHNLYLRGCRARNVGRGAAAVGAVGRPAAPTAGPASRRVWR